MPLFIVELILNVWLPVRVGRRMTAVGFGTPFLDNYFAALRKSRILFVVTLLLPLFQLWLSHLDALFVAVGTLTTAGLETS